jgi:hypothetical protein
LGSLVQLEQLHPQRLSAEALETWAQRVVRLVAVEGVKRKTGRVIDEESGT